MGRRVLCLLIVCLTAVLGLSAEGRAADPGVLGPAESEVGGKLGRELVDLRTRTSRTYVDSHGTRTARIFAGSVNYKAADGTWQAIDNTVARTKSGFRNQAGQYVAELPNSLSSGAVTVQHDGRWVSFALQKAKGTGQASGAQVRYAGAFSGVDATYEVGSDNLKETFSLAGPNAVRTFSFRLAMSDGLRPALRDTGVLEFTDADGNVRFSFGAPVMIDAAGARSQRIDYTLASDKRGWTLTTRPDDAWLDASDRKWPVAVDPGTYPVADPDCALDGSTPETSSCAQDALRIGWDGSADHRAILRFPVDESLPFDAEIYASTLVLNLRSQTDSTRDPTPVAVHRVTRSWTPGASWNRYDGSNRWGQPGGDYDSTLEDGYAKATGGTRGLGRYFWTITDLSNRWAHGQANYGLLMRDNGSQRLNVMTFDSSESASNRPYLDVRYQRRLGERRGYKLESFDLSDRMTLKVNSATGNLLLRQSDLTIPGGLGPDMTVGRTYNSFQPGPNPTAYGPAWTMDTASGIRLEDHGGYNQYFYGPSGYIVPFLYQDGTNFTTPKGFDVTLRREPDRRHTLTENATQTKYVFENAGADQTAKLSYIEDRNGRRIRFAYQPSSFRVDTITDSQDRVTQFYYDASGRIERMVDPAGREYRYGYNAAGQLATYTDPNNGVTRYDYAGTQLTRVTTPGGRVTTIAYYPAGDPNAGKVKQVVRVTNAADGTGPTTTFTYTERRDSSSDAWVTDPSGHQTKYVFDEYGRVTDVTDALGGKQRIGYTSNSNVQQYFAASNGSTTPSGTFDYDTDGNLVGTSRPTGSGGLALRTSATYGGQTAGGGAVSGGRYLASATTNEQGRRTRMTYTSEGDLERVRRVDGADSTVSDVQLQYAGDSPGKLVATLDGKGNKTTYDYDAKGNLTSIAPPLPLGQTTYSYGGHAGADQALSRVSSVQRPDGRSETYDYDNLDRLTKITFSDGTTVTNTWDADGNLTSQQDTAAGTRTLEYDQLNRLTRQAGPGADYVNYRYDRSGNLTAVEDPNGTTEYGYDAANRNRSVYVPGVTDPVVFDLDDDGNRTRTTFPNGVVTEQSFNKANQLLDTCTRPASAGSACQDRTADRLLDFRYGYTEATSSGDAARALQQSVTDRDGRTTTYRYDDLDRLRRAETRDSSGQSVTDWFEYDYDAAGNVTDRRRKDTSPEAYAYNGANELCWRFTGTITTRDCSSAPSGATTYQYDANGNETVQNGGSRGSSEYNARNQLTAVTSGGQRTALSYFGADQEELLSVGSAQHRSTTLGLSQAGADSYARDVSGGLVSQQTPRGREYFHLDALGSVRGLTTATGTVSRRFDYDPYGRDLGTDAPGANTSRLGYAGGEATGLGLYHFGQRYYDPELGRWTTLDTLDQPSDLRQANHYGYVGGDPVNMLDEDGTILVERWIARRYRTGERFIFSDRLRTLSTWGGRALKVIKGSGLVSAARASVNCARDLAGDDNPAGCDPIGNYLGIEDAY
jgi:RHS repeat-associated protein